MGKNNENTKISRNEQQLIDGLKLTGQHPLFGKVSVAIEVVPQSRLGKRVPAKVSSSGRIYLNKDCDYSPKEWAYIIAHCKLHLCFGHFDADKMPGYYQKISEKEKEIEK